MPEGRRIVSVADCDRFSQAGLWSRMPAPDTRLSPDEGDSCACPNPMVDTLRSVIATELTEKQREAVEAVFMEGLSQSEAARRIGITQQVLYKRLFGAPRNGRCMGGAIARLRKALLARKGPADDAYKT